jgi:TRAP-type C4-dicarboxylate transport system substrate-binding protein
LQELIRTRAVEASRLIGAANRAEEASYVQRLKDRGMEFNNIDKTALRPIVQKTYDDFIARGGSSMANLIRDIESTR